MTKKLTTSAMLLALSSVLSLIIVFNAPYGGSVTAGSMVPILIISYLYGTKWGLLSAFVFSLIQMLLGGIAPPPAKTVILYIAVVFLDYILAFTVLGLCGFFRKIIKIKHINLPLSSILAMLLRFLCHFLSGILIWHVYAPEGQSIFIYSLAYNGGYMLPEIIISTVILSLIMPYIEKIKN